MMRLPASAAYLLYAGGGGLFFACYATLANVYRIDVAHLDALQLVLVGTVLEGAVFLFEVPTGVVADSVSRRASVLVGLVLIGLGFLLEGSMPVFVPILLAQVVWGIGSTFESGAVDAWVADEVGDARAPGAFLRGAQVGQVAALIGIGLATILGAVRLALPLQVAGAGYLGLAALLAVTMSEGGHVPAPASSRRLGARLSATFAAGFDAARRRPVLRWILVVAVLAGASSEVFDRLWQARVLAFPLPLAATGGTSGFFGLVAAIAMVGSVAVTEVARRRVDTIDAKALARALMVVTSVLAVAVVAFGAAGNAAMALSFYFVAILMRRVNAPLFRAFLNGRVQSAVRATLFSIANQMDALGQIAAGPLLGVLALRAGMPWAFAACGALLVPAVWIFARPLASLRGSAVDPVLHAVPEAGEDLVGDRSDEGG